MPSCAKRILGLVHLIVAILAVLSFGREAAASSFVWDPSPDAAAGKVLGYKVYCSTQPFTLLPLDVATNPGFTVLTVTNGTLVNLTNLINGQTYFIAITAIGANNQESPLSNILSYTAGAAVSGTLNADGTVSFAWDPSPDAARGKVQGYKFYYSPQSFTSIPTDAATNPGFTILTVTNGTAVNLTNLITGQTYFMTVTALGTDNQESPPSNILSFTVAGVTKPRPPSNVIVK